MWLRSWEPLGQVGLQIDHHTHKNNPADNTRPSSKKLSNWLPSLCNSRKKKQLRHPDVLPLGPTYCHTDCTRTISMSHRLIMGVSNAWANTFPQANYLQQQLNKRHLTFPTGSLHQSPFTTTDSQARPDDPAQRTDKINVDQINRSREIIEQTIRGSVDYTFIVLLNVCTWMRGKPCNK